MSLWVTRISSPRTCSRANLLSRNSRPSSPWTWPNSRSSPASVLNYWLTVKDNKEPSPNKTETARQVIEVIEPVSPTNKKQIEENQKKEREQLDPTTPTTQDEDETANQKPDAANG